MASNNIQYLFSTIRPQQVISYLTKLGWTHQVNAGRIDFQSSPDAAGDVRRLVLPAEHSHPRFRSMIPNLVFGLAVTEQQEALDIANAIADEPAEAAPAHSTPTAAVATSASVANQSPASQLPAGQSSSEPARPQWSIVVANANSDNSITLGRRADEPCVVLAAGDAVRIVGHAPCKIEVTSDFSLVSQDDSPQVVFDYLPGIQRLGRASLVDAVREFLEKFASTDVAVGGDTHRQLAPALSDSLDRFDFYLGSRSLSENGEVLKAALAVLLVEVRQSLKQSVPNSQLIARLFALARLVLNAGKLSVLADGKSDKTLAVALEADSPAAPHHTLRWLAANSRSIG